MKPGKRAKRGAVQLVQNRSGYWAIRWGRAKQREFGVPALESTGESNYSLAEQVLNQRMLELGRRVGDASMVRTARTRIQTPPIRQLASDFLRAFAAGELEGKTPRPRTVERAATCLLGASGLVDFAEETQRELSRLTVERWLERFSRRSPDTRRIMLVSARRLSEYAEHNGFLTVAEQTAILAIKVPKPAKGRARREGTASESQVHSLIEALSPRHWGVLAEAQARLGLRRGELLALKEAWLDAANGTVIVEVTDDFVTKNGTSRVVDGVDAETMRLAHQACQLIQKHRLTASGYAQALKRACRRLEKNGSPWTYSATSHAFRSFYATECRKAGMPLHVVRDRLGHSSESTTERHYIGRQEGDAGSPFQGQKARTLLGPRLAHAG